MRPNRQEPGTSASLRKEAIIRNFKKNDRRDTTRRNHAIRSQEVRCVDEKGEQIGVISTREALMRAQELGMDLVEISPMAKPPVCRIMDYGKFKYDKEKKQRAAKKHHTATRLKEIKFHANVGEHDYQTKLRHALAFLDEGHRVRFSLYFRGRENAHREIGFDVMKRVAQDCDEYGVMEQAPRMMGRNLVMMMNAKPGGKKGKPEPAGQETKPPPAG